MFRGGKILWVRLAVLTVLFSLLLPYTPVAFATAASSFSDTLSTMKESVVANHTLTFTINDAIDAGDTFSIDFPDTFNTTGFANTDPLDYDIKDDGVDKTITATGGCAADGIDITTSNTTTDTFTFTLCAASTAIATSSVIEIQIGTNATSGGAGNTQITNQTAAENNSDAKVTLAGTFGGSGTLALEVVADNDVTVSATVDPSITCAFTGLTTTFASLTTGAISTSDTQTTITASANATGGINITVYDAGDTTNPGLYKSSATTYLIGSADSAYSNTATLAAG
ncbi:MAG: hypothetical protein NUV80_02560, partial [Candidatus Berkelbacteria bacterium]|nr:hypothetical protein [Candidatus Berkelbacteria bacterium]